MRHAIPELPVDMPLLEREDVATPRRVPLTGRPPLRADSADAVPVERRLPVHRGKVGRITDQLAGLSEDVREIVELRIQLVKREVMEQVEGRISSVKGQAVVGALAALTGVFLLLSLALGLGMLLGHAFWGFLIVSGLFVLATLIAKKKFMPGAVRVEHDKKTGKVRVAVEETPAEYESRKTTEDGQAHAHPVT